SVALMETEHEIHSIKAAEVIGTHALRLTFEDGVVRVVDLTPILHGKRFGPLRDPKRFAEVRINRELDTVEWPTGADFDPETLYHWDWYVQDLKTMAEQWETSEMLS
ncbi:MAG TPA: DUF2442 domain-containing protein, partial [Candidatus Kapabacteria bacterium]|nr:DUF2442 domain-containing protein [Candidatus Kapabacteria bacterium]